MAQVYQTTFLLSRQAFMDKYCAFLLDLPDVAQHFARRICLLRYDLLRAGYDLPALVVDLLCIFVRGSERLRQHYVDALQRLMEVVPFLGPEYRVPVTPDNFVDQPDWARYDYPTCWQTLPCLVPLLRGFAGPVFPASSSYGSAGPTSVIPTAQELRDLVLMHRATLKGNLMHGRVKHQQNSSLYQNQHLSSAGPTYDEVFDATWDKPVLLEHDDIHGCKRGACGSYELAVGANSILRLCRNGPPGRQTVSQSHLAGTVDDECKHAPPSFRELVRFTSRMHNLDTVCANEKILWKEFVKTTQCMTNDEWAAKLPRLRYYPLDEAARQNPKGRVLFSPRTS